MPRQRTTSHISTTIGAKTTYTQRTKRIRTIATEERSGRTEESNID